MTDEQKASKPEPVESEAKKDPEDIKEILAGEPDMSKPVEEYIPLTPMQKVGQRVEEGKPLEEILRYMHGQSKVLPEIRNLVGIAVQLEEGMKSFNILSRDGGSLRVQPGSELEGASDIVVQIGKMRGLIQAYKAQARQRVAELIEENSAE